MKFLKVTSKIALILTIFALFITCTGGQPESSLILFPQGPTRPPLGPGQSPDDVYDLGGGGFTPQLFTGNEGTWYQIFPISFYDTTGDGKGDLNGITHHLGYLSCELGCPAQLENVDDRTYCNNSLHIDGIWLTPIMKGTSYHKYDTEDYMSIDPDFGTLQDMRDLRDEARKRGIKLIVDLAVNHSSAVHPWFLNALEEWMSGDLGHYAHYYEIRTSWNRFPNKVHEFGTNDRWWRPDEMHLVIDALNERRQLKGQPPITEVRTPGGQYIFYYGIFGPWMPDFNFDNPDVKQEFVEITRFWLHEDEMDLDGFRLDATLHIYNAPGDWQGDHGRNIPFWEWFVDMARTFKPNVFLVGEAWTDPHTVLLYHTPGKSSFAFIFSLGGENRIVRAVNEGL
ncbi:MAG: hypothetical protein LBC80_10750, partial [Treponema sp.]|nr:hypothetical protein [Treponema sp.]